MTLNKFLSLLLLAVSSIAFANENEVDDDELLGAFQNLANSMGPAASEPEAASNAAVDAALVKAFDPVPPILEESSKISLDQVDGPATKAAVDTVAQVPIDGDLRSEYAQTGAAVSLLLWHGSKNAMRSLLTNILKDLYADNDPKNFRFTVDSSPTPILETKTIDLNAKWREEEIRKAEFESRFLLEAQKRRPKHVPERLGLEIRISAGMFATFKTVDELAAQIAKALARLNPTVYGFKEDPRFTKNQKYLEIINQIIEGSSDTAKSEAKEKKTEMLADFAAMERLNAAGYSPWALYNYEERYFTWIADIFLKSRNHSFARWLLGSKIYRLDDWSRPLRLQLQNFYMRHLQGIERGRDMNLDETEFSPQIKRIRFRLYLYTRPFFLGLWRQVLPVALTSGAVLFPYLFPHAAHSALEALNFSADGPMVQWLSEKISSAKDTVGGLLSRPEKVDEATMEVSYWGSGFKAAKSTVADFFSSYTTLITVGAGAITTAFLLRYARPIGNAIAAAQESWAARRAEKGQLQTPSREILGAGSIPEPRPGFAKQIDSPFDDGPIIETRVMHLEADEESLEDEPPRTSIFTTLAARLNLAGRATRAYGSALGKFAAAGWRFSLKMGADSLQGIADGSVATWRAGGRGARRFGNGTVAVTRATGRGTARSWRAFMKILRATPAALDRTQKAGAACAVRIGQSSRKKGVKAYQNSVAAGHFVFVDLPVGLYKGSLRTAKELQEWGAQSQIDFRDWREQYKIDSARKAREREIQRAKDKAAKAAKIEEARALKEAKRLAEVKASLDREARIDAGLDERERLLERADPPLSRLVALMNRFYLLEEDIHSHEKAEELGFSSKWELRKRHLTFLRALEKWVTTAENLGERLQSSNLVEVLDLMEKAHRVSFSVLLGEPYTAVGVRLYRLLEASPDAVIQHRLGRAHEGNGPIFLRFIRLRAQVAAARAKPASAGERATAISSAGEHVTFMAIEDLYRYHESEIVKWMAAPSTGIDNIRVFLLSMGTQISKGFFNREYRQRFRKAALELSLIERAKIHLQAGDQLFRVTDSKTVRFFADSLSLLVEKWCREATDIRTLAARIESELAANQLRPSQLQNQLSAQVIQHPELIKTEADALELFARPYFWSETISQSEETTPLEEPLVELLNAKREQFAHNPAWAYDPIFSEKVHALVKSRLVANNAYPTDYEGLENLWKAFTSRGVSTLADDILSVLLKAGSPEQIQALENYAVREGRVFDQGLRDEFAIRQIKRSSQYYRLIWLADQRNTDRSEAIRNLITLAQELMSDLGIRYIEFLEEISNRIRSTYQEAEMLHEAKAKSFTKKAEDASSGSNDSRLKTLYAILPYVKSWKPSRQYDFLLYLRGSIPATPFIIKQFPRFGPERIRKMYQGLPLEAAMAVINLYLQETLLARKSVHQGYGKKLMQFLVQKGSVGEVESQATLLLEGLLYGVEKAKNKPFQKQVLSALIAMKPDEKASLGETIKVILEQFPGIGPKVGQFLVATGLLKPDVEEVVAETQDNTLPPKRFDIYKDLENIVGNGVDIGIDLLDLLGSGSLKYSASGIERKTGHEVALQIFREDVQNNADLQIKVLNGLIEYAVRKGGQRWAFLQVIVDGAMNAVAREKEFEKEAGRTKIARTRLYSKFSDAEFDVAVPQQALVNKRLLVSRFAHGTSFRRLSPEDQRSAGLKILRMEAEVLWQNESGGFIDTADTRFTDELLEYDTDRHSGNYVTDATAQPKKKIAPIDFGQLTYYTRAGRERVVELFSYAAILVKLGSNDWLAERVAAMFELKPAQVTKLKSIMSEMYPMSHNSEIVAYFSLIAAINQALGGAPNEPRHRDITAQGKLDFFYTDFIRAHIQLAGLEKKITVPAEVMTPGKILKARVQARAAQHRQDMVLSSRQKLGIFAMNAKNKFISRVTGRSYEPIDVRGDSQTSTSSRNCESASASEPRG